METVIRKPVVVSDMKQRLVDLSDRIRRAAERI